MRVDPRVSDDERCPRGVANVFPCIILVLSALDPQGIVAPLSGRRFVLQINLTDVK